LRISILKKNLLANFAGNGWTALIAVVLIPFYIKFLGIEAWGMVGIFVSLQSICSLLDLGLSSTLNRELARLSVHENKASEMRDLVRTLETIYWAVAVLIGILLFALAPVIANHWVHAEQLPVNTIERAIMVMGWAIALQWPFGLYAGGLLGLQRQVLLSGINVGVATLRGAGAILILWKVSPTLQAFFLWQVVISILQTGLARFFLLHSLPGTLDRTSFQRQLLRNTWRFAAGISAITVLGVIFTQLDKVILSRLLTLEMFGYYALAGAVATSLALLVTPVFAAFYPRFTQLVSRGDEQGLKELYHQSCQLMSVLIIPLTIVMVFYSREILFLWTGNATTVERTHLVLSILVVGAALHGLMHPAYAVQFAYGWTRLAFYTHLTAVLLLTPLIILVTSRYGAAGAASIWVIFNIGMAVVTIQLMHRRVLRGEVRRWYLEDVGLPLIVSLGAASLCLVLAPTSGSRFQLLIVLASVTLFILGSAFLATPVTRLALLDYSRSWRAALKVPIR
jgi:O-antigen/teichoic acid export membrane protein